MSRGTHLATLDEFIQWANRQPASKRFLLSSIGWGESRHFHLEVAGTGGRWASRKSIYLPQEVGMPLGNIWKENEYGRYVGQRGIKSILKELGGKGLVKGWEVAQAAANRRMENQRKRNMAGNVRDYLERAAELIEKANYNLEQLQETKANIVFEDGVDMEQMIASLKLAEAIFSDEGELA